MNKNKNINVFENFLKYLFKTNIDSCVEIILDFVTYFITQLYFRYYQIKTTCPIIILKTEEMT